MVHNTLKEQNMISIKYNNKTTFEDVDFTRNGNLVTMNPTTPHTSGFTT